MVKWSDKGAEEIPVLFHNQLLEVFHKYTNKDPFSKKEEALVRHHFICQSALDIQHKLQRLPMEL